MAMLAKKKAEGEEHIRLAEKALKTSLTKWSPDHDSAGDEFSQAGTCFKVSKNYDKALDALARACECYKQCRSLYQAAKMLEQSVLICKESNKLDQITSLAERGGLLYRQHGSPESAAQLLEKAAKILEGSHPETALELYQKAADTIMVEDRPKQAADYLVKVSRLQAKAKMWGQAAETLESIIKLMQESNSLNTAGRIVMSMVLVELAREDVVGASKAFSTWGGYCDGDQSAAINTIINGFDEEDGDQVKQGLNSSAVKHLDVEFARMARDIKVPEGEGGLQAAAAEFGAQRNVELEHSKQAGAKATADTSHSFGVDPVSANDLGETKTQREEDVQATQRELEEEDDDDEDEGLC